MFVSEGFLGRSKITIAAPFNHSPGLYGQLGWGNRKEESNGIWATITCVLLPLASNTSFSFHQITLDGQCASTWSWYDLQGLCYTSNALVTPYCKITLWCEYTVLGLKSIDDTTLWITSSSCACVLCLVLVFDTIVATLCSCVGVYICSICMYLNALSLRVIDNTFYTVAPL